MKKSFVSISEELLHQPENKEHLVLKMYTKGSQLFIQGEESSRVMIIKSGLCKTFLSEPGGKDFIFEFLGRNEIIGELELIRNTPCLCNVIAMTDMEVFVYSKPLFQHLIKENSDISTCLIKTLADRVYQTSSRAAFQQLHTLEHSLEKLLQIISNQNLSISKEEMASYLGISTRSLNRVIKGKE